MWILLLLSVLVAASIPLILKYQHRGGSSSRADEDVPVKKHSKADLKDIWEIQDIKHGVIVLTGNRYRMVMRVAAADFFLLGEGEQEQVEDALRAVLMGISFPVQFLVTSEALNTRKAVQDVKENLSGLDNDVRKYAQEYASYLEGLTLNKTAAVRSAYAVLSFDTAKDMDYARSELLARATGLADGLQMARMNCEILDTPALVDLLHHLLNRGRPWRPSEADCTGVMESYHFSERQVQANQAA